MIIAVSSRELVSGPAQAGNPGEPLAEHDVWLPYGTRFGVGLKPYVPLHRAGMRMLPPILMLCQCAPHVPDLVSAETYICANA